MVGLVARSFCRKNAEGTVLPSGRNQIVVTAGERGWGEGEEVTNFIPDWHDLFSLVTQCRP